MPCPEVSHQIKGWLGFNCDKIATYILGLYHRQSSSLSSLPFNTVVIAPVLHMGKLRLGMSGTLDTSRIAIVQ